MIRTWRAGFLVPLAILAIIVGAFVPLPSTFGQYKPTGRAPAYHTAQNTKTHNAGNSGAKTANESFVVVAVGDDLQVILKAELNTLKKKVEDGYKDEMKRYQEAKKNKNSHDANVPKPVKKTVKTIGSTFKSKSDAEAYRVKILEQRTNSSSKKIY